MLWCEAVGRDYRGRLWGQGSLHYPGHDYRNPAAVVPSPLDHAENANPDQLTNSSSTESMIQEQNAQIASLRIEVLQEKQRHQSDTAQLHQTYANQIQRLAGMQSQPHHLQQQASSLAPQFVPMQASLGHHYVPQQAPPLSIPTYTSLLLNSTTNGFASPLVGGLAPDGPIVSTTSMSTPYTTQVGNMSYVSRSSSFDPPIFLTPTSADVGGNPPSFDPSNLPAQRLHIGVGGLTNSNGDGAVASYAGQNIHVG